METLPPEDTASLGSMDGSRPNARLKKLHFPVFTHYAITFTTALEHGRAESGKDARSTGKKTTVNCKGSK